MISTTKGSAPVRSPVESNVHGKFLRVGSFERKRTGGTSLSVCAFATLTGCFESFPDLGYGSTSDSAANSGETGQDSFEASTTKDGPEKDSSDADSGDPSVTSNGGSTEGTSADTTAGPGSSGGSIGSDADTTSTASLEESTGIDTANEPGSGSGDTDQGTDAPCELDEPFSTPRPLTDINQASYQDSSVYLIEDQRTAVFISTRPNNAGVPRTHNVWTASRVAIDSVFDEAALLEGANQIGGFTYSVAIAQNGLNLYIQADPAGISQLFFSTRNSLSEPFQPPGLLALGTVDGGDPWIDEDGRRLYFESSGGIFFADGEGPDFTSAIPLAELNSGQDDGSPVLTQDELTIYFRRTPIGEGAGMEIWMASRANRNAPFDDPREVAELNSDIEDVPNWISPDGCRIYLHRYSAGLSDLYVADKPGI